ncbi:amidohydrolase family protein [Flavobacterium sp.]|jgi:predicted TIM-barrel fold metal-dependent hydrolase|uniref:amidohydrolase family protein n=1 Tax=Flavobacterium sp. TaxID=239 RepID=UPI0022C18F8A|nr:amidohydrolase family protein [Flavobacterium sp.]MCZ8145826.1 amidohydrolase family protein [Flavobacterium sp.]MCZ8366412.1 amidohydrolase family protein [Flavobacterium sp.]
MEPKYNIHTHIFTGKCAPKDFLQVALPLGDGVSVFLKWLFVTRPVSWLIKRLGGRVHNRMVQFLKIGVMTSQQEIFETLCDKYQNSPYSDLKFIALTIDMNYMTDTKNKPYIDFQAQLQEVLEIKKAYPAQIFPFYGVDPRNSATVSLLPVQRALESGAFSGLKLYPPNGFFPFDPRLDALYRYAEEKGIPIMTHCTRGGSYYLGENVLALLPDVPPSLNDSHPIMPKVVERIKAYKNASDKAFRKAAYACNLFTHPENYLPVLDKYPRLKLCIAHMGGDIEILGPTNANRKHAQRCVTAMHLEGSTDTWYGLIKSKLLIPAYPNTYTDISYSLCDAACMAVLQSDLAKGEIPRDRVLFGTDYFMVTKENSELTVTAIAQQALKADFVPMMTVNNARYLFKGQTAAPKV